MQRWDVGHRPDVCRRMEPFRPASSSPVRRATAHGWDMNKAWATVAVRSTHPKLAILYGYNRSSTLACHATQPDREQLMNPNGTWITDGTMVQFMPTFGIAIVLTPIPTTISGSAVNTAISGKPVCLEGDERSVASSGCAYIAPPYTTPGVGTLKIMKLGPDQLSSSSGCEGKKTIVKGTMFQAVLEVQTPATIPGVGVPDPLPKHVGGTGQFIPNQFQCGSG